MKKYIFFTNDIHPLGGMQNYVRSKAEYLEEKKWKVYVIFCGGKNSGCAFPLLDGYVNGGIRMLHILPEQIFNSSLYEFIIAHMLEVIEFKKNSECKYVIESNYEYGAVWGEILARYIGAKHVCFNCNEIFRGPGKHYVEYIDFFSWKFQRRELAGISEKSLPMLFEGYMTIKKEQCYKFSAMYRDNVSEAEFDEVNDIPLKEWNITYFGRSEKGYFKNIITDIYFFAQKYTSHDILFLLVGSRTEKEICLVEELSTLCNVTCRMIGPFSEIPKKVFDISNVIIAGAGCAQIAYTQGVPTIVADAKTYRAMGILGYTTDNLFYSNIQYSFSELLEDVLIQKTYLLKPKMELEKPEAENAYEEMFAFLESSSQEKEYYEFNFKTVFNVEKYYEVFLEDFFALIEHVGGSKEDFGTWLTNRYGRKIGLFGIGHWGGRMLSDLQEDIFSELYDNYKENFMERLIEFPNVETVRKVDIMIISLLKAKEEVKKQLEKLKFNGKIITFLEIIFGYIEDMREGFEVGKI